MSHDKLPDKLSANEFRVMMDNGIIETKGKRLSFEGVIPEFQPILNRKIAEKNAGNKKIRNATKCSIGDVKFDSKLEMYAWERFRQVGLDFIFQHKIVLQPSFKLNGKTIRAITWTADFYFEELNIIIDAKGYANDIAPLKIKMAKYYYFKLNKHVMIYTPSNKGEVNKLLGKLSDP